MNGQSNMEDQLMLFGMKNLLLEKSLEKIENDGIDIGHASTLKKDELVDAELFEHEILKKGNKMADFYALYFSLENSVRKLVQDVLTEKHGTDWWETKVPSGVKDAVKKI